MSNNQTTNTFELQKNNYVAFDALSLRQLILDRLNSQKTFTDQNFIGSNLAGIIDIVAYAYNTLIYYLNKTSTESMFTEAQLYENISRIVKLIDYKPIGFQTSSLTFNCSAENLEPGLYTIPRYSYMVLNTIPYCFNEDITFSKNEAYSVSENLIDISEQKLLYQGSYQEYPTYTAAGDNNETVIVNTSQQNVDHFNIDVYVKQNRTQTWSQFTKTPNLFLEDGFARKYEITLNSSKNYEIKFGDGINGVKLETGDEVAIYYLASNGAAGEVGPGALDRKGKIIIYNTVRYNAIINDVLRNELRFLRPIEVNGVKFSNSVNSTPVKDVETPDQIRQNAPAVYRTQYRLVTIQDYEVYIRTNFSNFIADVKVLNNWSYISTYLKYFYNLGLDDPSKNTRALYNQIQYADSCNFNNIYILTVPKSNENIPDFLVPAQKQIINSSLLTTKMITTETVFLDPVYKYISFGTTEDPFNFNPTEEAPSCFLEIIKDRSSRRDNKSITSDIVNIVTGYFNRNIIKLGQTVDITNLTQQILSVPGVSTFYTTSNLYPNLRTEGLSVFVWNPLYPDADKKISNSNIILSPFEYPLLFNPDVLPLKVIVSNSQKGFEDIEY